MKKQSQLKNKLIIGVTGSFGSGKSTVAKLLASKGTRIIDADLIARSCIRKGEPAYNKIVRAFGKEILDASGEVDRRRLARLVFADKKLLNRLNAIVHPDAIRKIKSEIAALKSGVIILDAPLLIEAGLRGLVDKLVVVTASRKTQLARLLKKCPLTKSEIIKRVKSQMPLAQKKKSADFVIDNNGPLGETKKQVVLIRRKLWKS